MPTRKIATSIAEKVGYGPEAAKGMSHRVQAILLYHVKVAGRVVKEGERETTR
jgi:hypothetical protein